MAALIFIASFLPLAIVFLMWIHNVRFDVLYQPDGKYLIVWYDINLKEGRTREHKLFKL